MTVQNTVRKSVRRNQPMKRAGKGQAQRSPDVDNDEADFLLEELANLQEELKQKRDQYILVNIWARRFSDAPVDDHHLTPLGDVLLTQLMPMDRKHAPEGTSRRDLWPTRWHWQQLECRCVDGDPVFGVPGSLLGFARDLTRRPKIQTPYALYAIRLAVAALRRWDAYGPFSATSNYVNHPQRIFPRRMVELPRPELLDGWRANDFFLNDDDVREEFRLEGADIKNSFQQRALFLFNHTVGAGQRGYRGTGVLVDWRMIGEELRGKATGAEWLDDKHLKDFKSREIGNAAVVVIPCSGKPDPESRQLDAQYEFVNGVRYHNEPQFESEEKLKL